MAHKTIVKTFFDHLLPVDERWINISWLVVAVDLTSCMAVTQWGNGKSCWRSHRRRPCGAWFPNGKSQPLSKKRALPKGWLTETASGLPSLNEKKTEWHPLPLLGLGDQKKPPKNQQPNPRQSNHTIFYLPNPWGKRGVVCTLPKTVSHFPESEWGLSFWIQNCHRHERKAKEIPGTFGTGPLSCHPPLLGGGRGFGPKTSKLFWGKTGSHPPPRWVDIHFTWNGWKPYIHLTIRQTITWRLQHQMGNLWPLLIRGSWLWNMSGDCIDE